MKIQFIFLKDFVQLFLTSCFNKFHWKQQLIHSFVNSMCFLKTLKPLDQIQFEKDLTTDDSSFQQNSKDCQQESSFLNKLFVSSAPVLLTKQEQLLQNLMVFINSNNLFLRNIQQKLQISEQHLASSHQHLNQMDSEAPASSEPHETSDTQSGDHRVDHQQMEGHPLLTQMFGNKKYQYRLELQEPIPSTIFKERNINISLNLIDKNSQKILNSNIVHLCLGVCDENGHWITENKAGEDFMKGKTEIEMYHGEGSFLKVYPRDVSRHHPSGKVHFVVYSKPSMIKFSSSSNGVEKIVDSNEIEPLLISDLVIKAKKS